MQKISKLFKHVLYVCYGYIFNSHAIDMFQEYLNVLIEQKYFYLDEDAIKVTKTFVYQCIQHTKHKTNVVYYTSTKTKTKILYTCIHICQYLLTIHIVMYSDE